jgi:hypothetical protein
LTVNNVNDLAVPSNAVLADTQAGFSYTPPPLSYQEWRLMRFSSVELADPLFGCGSCDPDSDGCVNALEYAFGRDPHVAESGRGARARVEDGVLVLEYTRAKWAVDARFLVEAAPSLDGPWSSEGLVERVVNDDGVMQALDVVDSSGMQAVRFLRLVVWIE